MTREDIARVLFADWSWEDGIGDLPTSAEWDAYELGKELNTVGLTKSNFLETADAILPALTHK